MERVVRQQLLGPFPLGDVAVYDDQLIGLASCVSDRTSGGFQCAPRSVFVADPIFHHFSKPTQASFFRGLYYSLAIVRMDLVDRRSVFQVFVRIPENL